MNQNASKHRKHSFFKAKASSDNHPLVHLFLWVCVFFSLFPLYYMLVSATNPSQEILQGRLIPGTALFENFRQLLASSDFLTGLRNSLITASLGTLLSVLITSLAGYAFEIYHSRLKDRVMGILMLSIMVPGSATMIPLYMLFARLGLLNHPLGYILPFLSSAFLIMLFRQNARAFPLELIEAARMDGLTEIGIFFRIFFPTMRSVFATGVIVSFMALWNEYLWALIVMQSSESKTLALLLANLNSGYTIDYGVLMLLASLTTLPMALLFFLLQREFTQGLAGSIKA